MRVAALLPVFLLAGCAATAPQSDDSVRFQTSDRALQLIEEQGKATATMLGYAEDTDLVCESFHKTGSHITTRFCYTRAEMEKRRLNHQEEWREFTKGGACIAPGRGRGTSGIPPGVSCVQ